MNSAKHPDTTPRDVARCSVLLATLIASVPLVSRADGPTSVESMMMPTDMATHGQPMKMDEIMPIQMKRDGMKKQAVMKGDMANRKFMAEKLKQEESGMEARE